MSLEVKDEGQAGNNNEGRRETRDPIGEGLRRDEARRPEAPRDEGRRPARSMREMNRLFSRALGRQSTGEYLSKTVAALNHVFNPDVEVTSDSDIQLSHYRVFGMDVAEYNTSASAAVLMLPHNQPDGIYLFTHTILLEGSAPPPAALPGEWQGRRYDILQVTGDVWNEKFLGKVQAAASNMFPGKTVKFFDCGVSVMPQEVDPEKDQDKIKDLAFYATAAVTTISVEVLGYQERWALDFLDNRDSLDVSIDFSGEPLYTAAGLPKRTDVKLPLTATVWEEDGNHRQPLTIVGGSLELVYSPPTNRGDYSGFGRGRGDDTRHFYPVFNISTLDTQYKIVTLELLLLGLASTALLSDNLYWVNGFRPTMKSGRDSKSIDPRDIGALNYLVGGNKVDIHAANFDDRDFMDYFGTLTHEELVFGMQVEERGELTWIHQVFFNAAQGDHDSAHMIVDSADFLTDGQFSRCFKEIGGTDLVMPGSNRIILGTYKDDHGVHDLRDFDLLHFLNLRGDTDPELALAWQDTFDMTETPVDYRIERRLGILQNILGSNMKVKGFAQQVYFHWKFIEALARAVKACDVSINRVASGQTYGSTRARGNSMIGQFAGRDLGAGLFNTWGRRGGEEGRDYGAPFMGRVRRY